MAVLHSLMHSLAKDGKSEIHRASQQTGNLGES